MAIDPREQELERELADAEALERRERELELELELAEAEEREGAERGFDTGLTSSLPRAPERSREAPIGMSEQPRTSGRQLGGLAGALTIPRRLAEVMSDTSPYYDPKSPGFQKRTLAERASGSAVQSAAAIPIGMAAQAVDRPYSTGAGVLLGGALGGPAGALVGAGVAPAITSLAERAWKGDVAGGAREGVEQFVGPAPGQALDAYRETGSLGAAADRFLSSGGLTSAALTGLTLAGAPATYRYARSKLPGPVRANLPLAPLDDLVGRGPERLPVDKVLIGGQVDQASTPPPATPGDAYPAAEGDVYGMTAPIEKGDKTVYPAGSRAPTRAQLAESERLLGEWYEGQKGKALVDDPTVMQEGAVLEPDAPAPSAAALGGDPAPPRVRVKETPDGFSWHRSKPDELSFGDAGELGTPQVKPATTFKPTPPEKLERMGMELGAELDRRRRAVTGDDFSLVPRAPDAPSERPRPRANLEAPRYGEPTKPTPAPAGEGVLKVAPGRPPPPGGVFKALRALGWKHKTPITVDGFKGDVDKKMAERGQAQFEDNPNKRWGLTTRLVESIQADRVMEKKMLSDAIGVDKNSWEQWKEYGRRNAAKVDAVLRKMNQGLELDRAELSEYQSRKPMYDKVLRGMQQVYGEARSLGVSKGDLGPTYMHQQQSVAGIIPDGQELPSPFADPGVPTPERSFQKTRTQAKGDVDPINALDHYMKELRRKSTLDADAADIRAEAQKAAAAGKGDVAKHLEDWVREMVYEMPNAADISARATNASQILGENVVAGMQFEAKDPYHQGMQARVEAASPDGRYTVTFDGQPGLRDYTRTEVLAMKYADQIGKADIVDRIIDGSASTAARMFLYLNEQTALKGLVANPVRNLVGSSLRDTAHGVAAARDLKLGRATPEKLEFYERAGVLDTAPPEVQGRPGESFGARADKVGFWLAKQPDQISQVIALEAKLREVARENPNWPLDRIEAEAIVRAGQQSDLRSRAFGGPQGRTRAMRIFGFLGRSTANQLYQVAQLARQGKLARAAALVGVPPVVFGAIVEAGGGDFVKGAAAMLPSHFAIDAFFGRGATVGGGIGAKITAWAKPFKSALAGAPDDKVEREFERAAWNMAPTSVQRWTREEKR